MSTTTQTPAPVRFGLELGVEHAFVIADAVLSALWSLYERTEGDERLEIFTRLHTELLPGEPCDGLEDAGDLHDSLASYLEDARFEPVDAWLMGAAAAIQTECGTVSAREYAAWERQQLDD